MNNTVQLHKLRQQMATYTKKIQKGESFIIMKHSLPLFKISPVDSDEQWEEVIDFTKIKKGGVHIEELLSRL